MKRRWPVLLMFVFSGGAGLIYEVVWARQLVLVFGNTTQAVSAILTGFFGGMAIGSAVGGRLGDSTRRPLRLFGMLELVLVIVVLATPVTFQLLHEVYRGAYGVLSASPSLLALVRFGLSLLVLAPATILMGATLPTLTRYLTRDATQLSVAFGHLYAANTVGAIVGTVAAGFVLIELLGLTGTLMAGAACSAIAGVAALVVDRRRGPLEAPSTLAGSATAGDKSSITGNSPPTRLRLALAIAFVSGLTSLGYQVLWTRMLASGTGNSTYVFTTILAVFLLGLAIGAVAFSYLRPRIDDAVSFLAHGQLMIALLVVAGMITSISQQLMGFLNLASGFGAEFIGFLRLVAVVVLPATFVLGLTLPAAASLVADPRGRVATNTGLLLSINTLGAITGTFVIPFFIIPAVGSPAALGLLALGNLGLAIALAVVGGMHSTPRRVVVGATGVLASLAVTAALVAGGVFVDPSKTWIARNGGVVFASSEDEIASVQAGRLDQRQLWVTGTSMTLLTVDAKLMPLMPLMVRPGSTTALTVAFGMGSTFRTALIAGLKTDAVELVPSVPSMFRWFYPDAQSVIENPMGRVIITDGRNHVELTSTRYDIIITDPPPPLESSGVSVIASREYYIASKARLNPGGVMMQWLPYGQTLAEFKSHIRTYRNVFPYVIIAFGPGGYGFFLLGSERPLAFDPAAVRGVLSRPGILEDLSSAFDSPASSLESWTALIPRLVWLEGDRVSEFAGTGPLITDDRPLPEYFLLRHLFGESSPQVSPDLLNILSIQRLSEPAVR